MRLAVVIALAVAACDDNGVAGAARAGSGVATDPDSSVASCAAPPPGLIGHWTFDASSGNTATDAMKGNDGPLEGPGAWVNGRIGGALRFDGTQRMRVRSPFPFQRQEDRTLSFWIRPSAETFPQTILWAREDEEDSSRFSVFVEEGPFLGLDYREARGVLHRLIGGGSAVAGPPIELGTWAHVAIVRSDSTYAMYLDGNLWASKVDALPALPQARAWQLSGRSGSMYRGDLDDLRLYGRALDPSEVVTLYCLGGADPAP